MLTYPFCCQTVTVYRLVDGQVQRTALENCFYRWEDTLADTDAGVRFQRKFLLIQPGEHQLVFPGDRVMAGEGPEDVSWDTFLPENTPTLGQVAYATPWYWAGKIAHTEAGRK